MNWSKYISTDELSDISSLIKSVETNSSAEIITVIANRSSTVKHVKLIIFLLLSITTFTLLSFFEDEYISSHKSLLILLLHVFYFVVSFFLAKITTFQRWFIPKYDQLFQVDTMAEREFYVQRLHMTKEKTGILIYLSLLEKRAVVLADEAINKKLPNGSWQEIINHLINGIHNKNIHQGLIDGISSCSTRLEELFPPSKNDKNELPNHVILRTI